uniref:Uncharacterized protein n=1 Tax=Panagrolaimus superbus TaxID=310955 RepID=A0A914Z558_9BILA
MLPFNADHPVGESISNVQINSIVNLPPLPLHRKPPTKPFNPEVKFLGKPCLSNAQVRARENARGNANIFNDTRPTLTSSSIQQCDPTMIIPFSADPFVSAINIT